ncbi:MAG: sugar transferase [Pseudomonadota bacterium]
MNTSIDLKTIEQRKNSFYMTSINASEKIERPITNNAVYRFDVPERFMVSVTNKFIKNLTLITTNPHMPNLVVLNFSATKFIDSSGIGSIVKCIKIANKNNIKLMVSNVSKQIMSVFKMTGLDQLLPQDDYYARQFIVQSETFKHLKINSTHVSINSKIKRAIDIAGSTVGLFITCILFIPIAVAIKIESPGPIIFSQQRVGWLSKRFKIYKFRTMFIDAESRKHEVKNQAQGAIFKCSDDPRITHVGRFLRKTSLDELPQFWNVLEGSMSLVGTRPPTQDELDQYNISHWRRLDVKPGITGEWQVNGRSHVKSFEDVIQLDLAYQKKWNLLYDIYLLLKTIKVIFSKNSGAM